MIVTPRRPPKVSLSLHPVPVPAGDGDISALRRERIEGHPKAQHGAVILVLEDDPRGLVPLLAAGDAPGARPIVRAFDPATGCRHQEGRHQNDPAHASWTGRRAAGFPPEIRGGGRRPGRPYPRAAPPPAPGPAPGRWPPWPRGQAPRC